MTRVAPPIMAIDSVNNARRPIRSPTMPSTRLPNGRARKPSAKTPNVSSCCAAWLDCGKNCLPISLAKYPYTAKSNHSRTLPISPASAVRTADCLGPASRVDIVRVF